MHDRRQRFRRLADGPGSIAEPSLTSSACLPIEGSSCARSSSECTRTSFRHTPMLVQPTPSRSRWVTNPEACTTPSFLRGPPRQLSAPIPSSALFRFCRADAQALNAYCDDLASGRLPPEARLSFFVRDTAAAAPSSVANAADAAAAVATAQSDGGLRRIEATLPARGSLAPLLHAFGLLSDTELQQEEQQGRPGGRLDRETIDYAFLADRSRRISAMQMLSRRGCGQAGCGATVLHVRTAIAHHQHRRWCRRRGSETGYAAAQVRTLSARSCQLQHSI